jgi:hypothetical protein
MPFLKLPKFACATKTVHSFFDWWMHYMQRKCYVQCHLIRHVTPLLSLQHYMMDGYICVPSHSANATRRNRLSALFDAPATMKKRMEEMDPTNFCTYWSNNPAFGPKRVLLLRLFFYVERSKYVYVGFYPARDYLPLVVF